MRANEFDVLVIGEGLSGITAAAAACQRGAHVMLASKGPGTFVLGTACVDLEGLHNRDLFPTCCGSSGQEEAIRFFVELTAAAGCAYEGGVGERRMVPTIMGTFADVSLALRSLWKGDPRTFTKAVVVGIESLFAFDARFVAARLSVHCRELGLSASYCSADIGLPPSKRHGWLTPLEMASEIDRNPFYRQTLIACLKRLAQNADLLILPGVLGLDTSNEEIRRIEDEIGCAICELPTLPPSVPGLRLLRRLESHLTKMGTEICTGFSIRNLCIDQGRCVGAVLDTPGRPRTVHADSVILASGKFSRLLESDTDRECLSTHVDRVSQQLQPLNSLGALLATNVYECGSVLGKLESRYGNAIAIVSGYHAGMLACEQGVHYARP